MAFATITIESSIIELTWGDLVGFCTRVWPPVFLNTFLYLRFLAAAEAAADARVRTFQ